MKRILVVLACAAGLVSGCASPTGSTSRSLGGSYIPSGDAKPMTIGLNNTDLNIVAQELTDAMKRKGLPEGFVVGLGPVDTSGSTQPNIRHEDLEEAIRAALEEDGAFQFSEVVEADRGKVAELMKVKDLNWDIANPDDVEEKYKIGRVAYINGLLIGRVSSEETITPDGKSRQIVYRFAWRIMNVDTGIGMFFHRYQLSKAFPLR